MECILHDYVRIRSQQQHAQSLMARELNFSRITGISKSCISIGSTRKSLSNLVNAVPLLNARL